MFSVKPGSLKTTANQMRNVSTSLLSISNEINQIGDSLDSSLIMVKPTLISLSEETRVHSLKTDGLISALEECAREYERCEVSIMANISSIIPLTVNQSDGSTNLHPDPRGERTGIPSSTFVRIVDENGNVYYGGDQSWFTNDPIRIRDNGCGVIAAVNEALYLSGVTEISKEEYMKLVEEYFKQDPARKRHVNSDIGAWPSDIGDYVSDYCKKNGIGNSSKGYNSSWSYLTNDFEDDYKYMKESTGNGTPVIWAMHNQTAEELHFYAMSEKTGALEQTDVTFNSHYVTVTGVWEKQRDDGTVQRMVEVSSGGRRYYVDYDEYKEFAKLDKIPDLLNLPGNGVLKLEEKK